MSLVKKSDELRRVIEACRGYFVTAGVFSLAINLLYLAAPLYMLQVYDRVISSSSEVTLVMLTFALIMALLALAGLDAVRARVLTRASIRLDRLLAGRIMSAIIEGAQNLGGARSQLLRDFDTFRQFITGAGQGYPAFLAAQPQMLPNKVRRTLWIGGVVATAALLLVRAQAEQPAPTPYPNGILAAIDHRVPISPDAWPWISIGRVNVSAGLGRRNHCTGTLIGPRQVLTAAHCLFDTRLNTWVKPQQVHFVAGQSRDGEFRGHAEAVMFVTDPDFRFAVEERPRYDQVQADMVARDWAIITLADRLSLKPILWRIIRKADLPSAVEPGEVARAGYSQDRPFLLSVHRGCSVKTDVPQPGSMLHQCDSMPGDSGSPILLLKGEDANVVGLHTAVQQSFEPGVGYRPISARGVSASAFAAAAASAVAKNP